MATPSRLARLGIGAVSSTRAPACFQVRCTSTAQTTSTAPTSSVLPSGVREALQGGSLRQHSQLISSLQEPVSVASAQQVLAPEPFLFRYQFREPLIEGVILRKRKRFTADVAIDGQVVVCHCPTTCLSLYQTLLDGQQVRCLLSRADPAIKRQKQRETQYSLEAISLNGSSSWIGINQSAVTRYIEHYLRAGGLTSICADSAGLRAERMVGRRRIDFVYENRDSIEVKMPPPRHMREAALKGRVGGRPYSERMLGQVVCMTKWLQEQRAILGFHDKAYMRARQMRLNPEVKDPRAIMLLAYQHEEPPMRLPKRITGAPSPLMIAMREAIKAGLEIWQVNMELDRHGVALKSYFRRHLVPGRPQRHLSVRKGHDYMRDASCPLPLVLTNNSSSQALVPPQDSVMSGQMQLASDSGSLVDQQGVLLKEPSLLWQPDIVPATHEPHLERASLAHLPAGGSMWEEGGSSETVRELMEEEELAAAAA